MQITVHEPVSKNVRGLEPPLMRKRLLPRLGTCMIFWIVMIVMAVDILSRSTEQVYEATGYVDKLIDFFQSDSKPDLILLGSSVALSSSFESDRAIGILTDGDRKHTYTGAEQLARSIESATGKRLSAVNLACFGAMTDYCWMCTEKMIEFKKVPKVIIYEAVSRDFFDASMPRVFENPYYRALAFLHPTSAALPAPVASAIDWLVSQPLMVALSSLGGDDPTLEGPERMRYEFDALARACLSLYDKRVKISSGLTNLAGGLLNRPTSLHASLQKNMIENKKSNPFSQLSAAPAGAYQTDPTPQLQRFEQERAYFGKLLKLCKEKGIELVVVNMPVTSEYDALVPTPLRSRWPAQVAEPLQEYGFTLIDLDNKRIFTRDHFIDMAHLNQKGSLKVNFLLSSELSKRGILDRVKTGSN